MTETQFGETITIWPSGPPERAPPGLVQAVVERSVEPLRRDRNLTGVTDPFLEIVRARDDLGSGLLILPGGGYRRLAWDNEGLNIACWFAERGITAFVLAYRLPRDGWSSSLDAPLADAQRAIRLIRRNAEMFRIDPEQLAAIGFSAGAHLCANLAARFASPVYPSVDDADLLSARPTLAAAIYPAIDLQRHTVTTAVRTAAGESLTAYSPLADVPDAAPPHFIVHAEDDQLVPSEESLALRAALVAKGIPVETHLFSKGDHGFGLHRTEGLPVAIWPECLLSFGRLTGWIR